MHCYRKYLIFVTPDSAFNTTCVHEVYVEGICCKVDSW